MNEQTRKHLFGSSCMPSIVPATRETDQWDVVPATEGSSLVSLLRVNKCCAMELGTGALRAPRRESIVVSGQGREGPFGR